MGSFKDHFFTSIAKNLLFFLLFSGYVFPETKFEFGTLTMTSLKLLGDAHLSNGSVRLTRDLTVPNSGAGKVLYSKPIKFRRPGSRNTASFSTFFSFSITNLNPSSIGGGLAFVISPDDHFIGDAGGFMGIVDGKGGKNVTVAVEFDTLMDIEFKDINGNHVGLDLNSMVSSEFADLDVIGVDLKSGDLISSWIDYSGSSRTIKVYVSYSNLKPEEPIISAIVDLEKLFDNDFLFVGFSGSTQGSTEIHSIDWWSFTSFFDENQVYPSETPPPPPANLMNPSADSVKPQPPSTAPTVSDRNETVTSEKQSNGKCHNHLCRDGPGAVVGVATAGAFFFVICALLFIWLYTKKIKGVTTQETLASEVIKMPKEFTYKDLKFATKGFDSNRVIGHGAFGTVYKGILPSTGDIIAVKRCSQHGQGKAEFLSELSIIGTLRHRNLVRLQGWCQQKGEILLVYDLMTNGSLDKALYDSKTVLPWTYRRKILLGVASALAYLHQECENQVIHRDIKASNIMLDEGFNARLGDFGLARQIEHDKSPAATLAAGTMGYLAPEYLLTGRATEKTDVFSFGAVVLEVASGRRPIEKEAKVEKVGSSSNLVEWVWNLHGDGKLMLASDPRLGAEFDETEMRRVIMIGLSCSHPDPMARPTMRGVVQMLTGDADVPLVPRTKPALSFSTSQLLMTLQDSMDGLITLSDSSSESSLAGSRRGVSGNALDMV